jgi:Arc/MetJ family transcription regulator
MPASSSHSGGADDGPGRSQHTHDRLDTYTFVLHARRMRTNIVLNQELVERAKALTGLTTARAVVEEALHTLVRLKEQAQVRKLRGKLRWEGSLDELRGARRGHPR